MSEHINTTSAHSPKIITAVTTLTSLDIIVQNLNASISNNEHSNTISYATSALNLLFLQQTMDLLDARAYAYSMQGQPELAIKDANQIIKYSSTSTEGYLRKANIFTMYGKQTQAIAAYKEGLQNTTPGKEQQISIGQMEKGLAEAVKQNKVQVGFISKLPTDIVTNVIIPLLSPSTNASCLSVSKFWREVLINCSSIWENLSAADDNPNSIRLFNMIPSAGAHVKYLTIDTNVSAIHTDCFRFMKNGHLSRIESFKMKKAFNSTKQQTPYAPMIAVAFWQISQTLTTLDLNFGNNTTFTLADIFMSCTNLIKLAFTTEHSLHAVIGNFLITEQHSTFIDLQIKSERITGQDIESMLQRCQRLRRLIMNTCEKSVFDVINEHAPNLEILGYNPDFAVEELNTKEIQKTKGIQVLYTNNGGASVPAGSILPLVFKNHATLRDLSAIISPVTEAELQKLYSTWPNFRLNNVKTLTTWMPLGIQEFLLQTIRYTTTLTNLNAVEVHNIDELVNELLNLAPLSTFKIQHVYDTAGRASLVRLFEHYARVAEKTHSSLEFVFFRYCDPVSDDVLSTVTKIKTLHKISLCGLENVTTDGIANLISKCKNQLTYLKFEELESVTDDVIFALGGLKKLNYIDLKNLKKVTDQGIRGLLDTVDPLVLTKMVVKDCPKITKECITWAKSKINVVEYN